MARTVSKGNCFICGETLSEAAFKKHALSAHPYVGDDAQDCAVFKVKSPEDKSYWLYLDVPLNASLKSLDAFLREIWLECCGHMSAFFEGRNEIGMGRKISSVIEMGELRYEYDFGSTTELTIAPIGEIRRATQRKAARLIGRNELPLFLCGQCGAVAESICQECMWDEDSPLFCKSCAKKHEHDEMLLPVTNSPRMGVCGYCGESDQYKFDPATITIHK